MSTTQYGKVNISGVCVWVCTLQPPPLLPAGGVTETPARDFCCYLMRGVVGESQIEANRITQCAIMSGVGGGGVG